MMTHTTRPYHMYRPVNPSAFADAADVSAGVAAGGTLPKNGIFQAIVVGVAVSVASHFAIRLIDSWFGGRRG